MRIACLRVPQLLLAAELRASPELIGQALAIAAGRDARAELLAVSPQARAQGLRPGATRAQAMALCPELCVRTASPALEESARATLLDVALGFAPRAELAPRGAGWLAAEACVCLDASGIAALFPSEQGFAAALAQRAAAAGLPGDVGIACSRLTARLAALQAGAADPEASAGTTRALVIPAGREAECLARLPLDWLGASDSLLERCARFGIRTLGELFALPRASLITRIGREAEQLARLARGAGGEPPLPLPEHARLLEAVDLELPIDRLEPLCFALQGLISRLRERLALRQLAVGELELELALDGGGRDLRRIGLAAPSADPKLLLRLVRAALETRPAEAAVVGLRLCALGAPACADQLDLFRPAGPAPAALSQLLNELRALCGAERVGAPALPDDYHPDALQLRPFRPGRERATGASGPAARSEPQASEVRQDAKPSEPGAQGVPALRQLRPAVPAQVRLRAGLPSQVTSAIGRGDVVALAGPWRTTGGWWSREGRFAYDSFDVQIDDGTLLRLRLDHLQKCWEIDAIYD